MRKKKIVLQRCALVGMCTALSLGMVSETAMAAEPVTMSYEDMQVEEEIYAEAFVENIPEEKDILQEEPLDIDVLLEDGALTYKPSEEVAYSLLYEVDEQGVVITGIVADEGTDAEVTGELVLPQTIDGVQVYKIGTKAFYNLDGLTGSIVIPDGVKEIDAYAFYDCDGFEGDLMIGEGVETIGNYAFGYNGNMKGKLYLPESLITIGDYAFASCVSLTGEAKLPSNLEQIGKKGLCWCGGLGNKLVFGDKLQVLGEEAICPVTTGRFIIKTRVYFAGSITEIGDYAFGCVDRVYAKETGNYAGIALPVYVYAPKDSEVDIYINTHDKIKLGSNINYVGLDKNFPFQDVDTAGWKYTGIEYAYQRDLMAGVSATEFQPDAVLTRSQFVTVLYSDTYEPKETFETPFTDVAEGMWYSDAVVWATNYGIVSGYPEYVFGVEDNITREQFVLMLYQFAQLAGKVQEDPEGSLEGYADSTSVQEWAREAMLWAVQSELVSGKPSEDGSVKLDPQGNATRAECATIMMKFDMNF